MMQTRRTPPRRASRFAPTLQPRSAWRQSERLPLVAPIPIRLAAVADRQPRFAAFRQALSRFERRALMPIALSCLVCGLLFTVAGGFADSVVASHAGKSAMIFGFAGLRRAVGFGPEAVDASP